MSRATTDTLMYVSVMQLSILQVTKYLSDLELADQSGHAVGSRLPISVAARCVCCQQVRPRVYQHVTFKRHSKCSLDSHATTSILTDTPESRPDVVSHLSSYLEMLTVPLNNIYATPSVTPSGSGILR